MSINDEMRAAIDPDWTVLDDPRVAAIADQASRKLGATLGAVTTVDDEYQEAALYLATNADMVRAYLADELIGERNLHRWLVSRLTDALDKVVARSNLNTQLEFEFGAGSDDGGAGND